MAPDDVLLAAAALSEPASRSAAAQALARLVGADSLLVLIHDPAVDALVPAPGFPQTLPGGALWREFLAQSRTAPHHRGAVGFPLAIDTTPANCWTVNGAAFVFIGRRCSVERVERMLPLMPVLSALFAAEHDAIAARGELRAAEDHARQAEGLAKALDAARAEVERGMQEVGRQTEALVAAHRKAEDAARAKDEFLAMLGHELRNPLSPIVTALQLLRLKNVSTREQDVIERQVSNLMRLVDDLLDISRITRGRIELRRSVVEIGVVIAQSVEIAAVELERKRQRLRVAVPAEGLRVDVDAPRMIQVITNLLTNASKYSDPDTEITVTAEERNGLVRIAIRDQGIGLPPEMLEGVFGLFVQTPQALDRSQGGLGLGLAIVRSLAQLHGGRVWAESEGHGRGSTFVVELPRSAAMVSSDPPPVRAAAGVAGVPTPSHRHDRVLVVDDNEDARIILTDALESMGYEVRSAADGPSALAIARDFAPRLAVLDIGLPVMDGYELAQQLRAALGGAELRLIALTGYGQESDRRRSREAGFDAHLVKPIVLEDLASALDASPTPSVPRSSFARGLSVRPA